MCVLRKLERILKELKIVLDFCNFRSCILGSCWVNFVLLSGRWKQSLEISPLMFMEISSYPVMQIKMLLYIFVRFAILTES